MVSDIVVAHDYYPYGLPLPGREITEESYRFDYQGQFAEKDEETGWNSFETRMWDPVTGRWLIPDPERQFASPYLGMGNSPVNGVDPDGEWFFGLFGPSKEARREARRIAEMDPSYDVSIPLFGKIKFSQYANEADVVGNSYSVTRWDYTLDNDLNIAYQGSEDVFAGNVLATGATNSLFDDLGRELALSIPLVRGARWLGQGYRAVTRGGRTFSQYKKLYWASKSRVKPIYQPIRLSNGKVFKVYTEFHHRYIPQRWKWAPNWLKNNRFNLQPLNTIQHGIRDPYRFRFFPTEIKNAIRNGQTFGY